MEIKIRKIGRELEKKDLEKLQKLLKFIRIGKLLIL